MISHVDVILCAVQIEAGRNNGHTLNELLMIRTGRPMPECLRAITAARRAGLVDIYSQTDVVVLPDGMRHLSDIAA